MDARVSGSCLCGSVRFSVGLPTLFCGHCHCSICRRSHGAGFVTWFGVPRSQFQLAGGEDQLVRYRSSDHGTRMFCGRCGSSLFSESSQHPDQIEVVLASMESPIDRLPEVHIFFHDRAAWVVTDDGLPRLGGSTGFEPIEPAGEDAAEIRELAEVPGADWQELFAGSADPFEIEPLGLRWRPKDTHFVLYVADRAASHVSILVRHEVRVGSEPIAVTGVAGVVTRPDLRHRGLARRLLQHALGETRSRAGTEFALLFCLPKLVALYRGLGWQEVASVVHVEQPSGVIEAPLRTMILPLGGASWPGGPVWLDSAPW